MVWFDRSMRNRLVSGSATQRTKAALTIVGWFAMGAFVVSSLEHHLNLLTVPDSVVAICGGAVAAVFAVFKTV